jgi:hypothetical protein
LCLLFSLAWRNEKIVSVTVMDSSGMTMWAIKRCTDTWVGEDNNAFMTWTASDRPFLDVTVSLVAFLVSVALWGRVLIARTPLVSKEESVESQSPCCGRVISCRWPSRWMSHNCCLCDTECSSQNSAKGKKRCLIYRYKGGRMRTPDTPLGYIPCWRDSDYPWIRSDLIESGNSSEFGQ